MAEFGTTIHVALSVDVDRNHDKYILANYGEMFAASGIHTIDAIRKACADMRAKGFAVFPPCDNTNADGTCAGHKPENDDPKPANPTERRVVTAPCQECDLCLPTDENGCCSKCAATPKVEVDISTIECVVCGDGATCFNDHWDPFCDTCSDAHASGFIPVLYVAELEANVRLADLRLLEAVNHMRTAIECVARLDDVKGGDW